MYIVKLHATTSTNDELKIRFRESELHHLTTIYSLQQSHGRGQRGTVWQSEAGKNLTFSTLLTRFDNGLNVFDLNRVVSVILAKWLRECHHIQAKVKWPNDILSVRKKLAGILIEPIFKNKQLIAAVVGIGLNVNQQEFETLPQAISMNMLSGNEYELEPLLVDFLDFFDKQWSCARSVLQEYYTFMYKYNQSCDFLLNGESFTAVVKEVNHLGQLGLYHDHDMHYYQHKEIVWCL